jgi:hypothetical protein
MFTSEATSHIFQQHMKETDPILIRIQCDSVDEYALLQYRYSKTIWIAVFSIIIVFILTVLVVLFT